MNFAVAQRLFRVLVDRDPRPAARNVGLFRALEGEREDIMIRDLLTLAAASIMVGAIVWSVFGNPQKRSSQGSSLRIKTSHSLNAHPDLRLISERSEYMRTER
jgi:hypothetical protein